MPVSAEKQKLYPGGSLRSAEWRAIVARICHRAGNRCEICGVANHALGGRASDGTFHPALPTGDNGLRLTWPAPGEWAWVEGIDAKLRIIRIVCTTMHLNHDTTDNGDENLKFGCQRCHNLHDAAFRRANALRAQHLRSGQMRML
jgi:hypothetical protein